MHRTASTASTVSSVSAAASSSRRTSTDWRTRAIAGNPPTAVRGRVRSSDTTRPRRRSTCLPGVGRWDELVARLDGSDLFVQWSRLEPALLEQDLPGLREQLAPGADPRRAELLVVAVLRLAAADGHDQPDAVLLLLHLLADGARAVAVQLRDLSLDTLSLVVGELAVQIRSFPSRRNRSGVAGALLMDTKAALLRELLPHRVRPDRSRRQTQVLSVDPTDRTATNLLFAGVEATGGGEDLDLLDMLLWAQRTGVVDPVEVALLLHAERSRAEPGPLRLTLERCWGESGRTLRRRRMRTLSALQAASSDYLRDCA